MIQPRPFKFVCPKCEHTKVVKPKSDVVDLLDFYNICPKCKSEMERKELGILDRLFPFS